MNFRTPTISYWKEREEGTAQPLKNDITQGHDINRLEPDRSKIPLDGEPGHQQVKWHTHKNRESSKADHNGQEASSGPTPGNIPPTH